MTQIRERRELFLSLLLLLVHLALVNSLSVISPQSSSIILFGLVIQTVIGYSVLYILGTHKQLNDLEKLCVSFLVGIVMVSLIGLFPSEIGIASSALCITASVMLKRHSQVRNTHFQQQSHGIRVQNGRILQQTLLTITVINFVFFRYQQTNTVRVILVIPFLFMILPQRYTRRGLLVYAQVACCYIFFAHQFAELSPTLRSFPISFDDVVEEAIGKSVISNRSLDDFMQLGERFSYPFFTHLYKSAFSDIFDLKYASFDPAFTATVLACITILLVAISKRLSIRNLEPPRWFQLAAIIGVWPLWESQGIGSGSDSQILGIAFVVLFLISVLDLRTWCSGGFVSATVLVIFLTKAPLVALAFFVLVISIIFSGCVRYFHEQTSLEVSIFPKTSINFLTLFLSIALVLIAYLVIFTESRSKYSERGIGLVLPRGYWDWPSPLSLQPWQIFTFLSVAFLPLISLILIFFYSIKGFKTISETFIYQLSILGSVPLFMVIAMLLKTQTNFNFYFAGLAGLIGTCLTLNLIDFTNLKRNDFVSWTFMVLAFSTLFFKLNFSEESIEFEIYLVFFVLFIYVVNLMFLSLRRGHRRRVSVFVSMLALTFGAGVGDAWSPVG